MPSGTTISVIIPTLGLGYLDRTLRSIQSQAIIDGDQFLVVADTATGPVPGVEEIVSKYGSPFEYHEYKSNGHHWGNPQRNYGISCATGDYVSFMDDDDIYAPHAFDAIRQRASEQSEPKILMFKLVTSYTTRIWVEPKVIYAAIGGHCIVVPNDLGKMGRWSDRYSGDFDFIQETVNNWGEDNVVWCRELIAIARPEER